ncbi:MAG: tetratricopeptide repeat protein [Gemmatimonadaceae bacterium]|nr:tetratricopeptide repeat protein [Gemmatimonadaceae bacterium]
MALLGRLKAPASLVAFVCLAACTTVVSRVRPSPPTAAAVVTPAYTRAEALAKADEAWEAGEFPVAKALYGPIVERDVSPPSAAFFRLATLLGWDNRLAEAENLFRRYVALEPGDREGRVALGRALAWQGRYDAALAVYDSVLTLDPQYRNAVLARAQALAWAGRLRESLSVYERWIASKPADRDARLDYARALAWDGRLREAETLYTELARTGNRDATKGLARVIGWRGELERSERMWRRVLVTDPNDAEARTGLAQVLSWQGRQLDAETELQLVLRASPGYGDARSLLRTVQADLRPNVATALIGANDSDRNRVSTLHLDYIARPVWNGSVGARYSERWADFAATDSRASAVSLFASWQPRPGGWIARADAGVSRQSFTRPSSPRRHRTIGNGGIRFVGGLGPGLRVGLGASRSPFDETALLIANGIVISSVEAEASLPLPARLSLAGGAAYSRLTGGLRENSRRSGSATLRWTASRRWSIAVGTRQFGYDTSAVDGYFSPRHYTLADASLRGRLGDELGWNADGEAGLGRQSIGLFDTSSTSRRAERLAASVGYRFSPAREVAAAATYSNVAAPGQAAGSDYRASSVLLRARVGF